MKTKRIAQLCCAALVAAGIGLNIQNALTDYGLNENSLSLVAAGGTGNWCSFSMQSNSANPTNSNGSIQSREGRVENCSNNTGLWRMYFDVWPDGHEDFLYGNKLSHQRWVYYTDRYISRDPRTGKIAWKYVTYKGCEELPGDLASNCQRLGEVETVSIEFEPYN